MQCETTPESLETRIASYRINGSDYEILPWFAVQTLGKRERVTAKLLVHKGFESYWPSYKLRKRQSDRVVEIEKSLFPGYLFCRFNPKVRMPILTTPGVLSVVGFGSEPAPVDKCEVDAVRAMVRSGLPLEPCHFLTDGRSIRVTQGCLQGLEGIITRRKSEWRLVVSVSMLQRSVSVEVDRDWIVAI